MGFGKKMKESAQMKQWCFLFIRPVAPTNLTSNLSLLAFFYLFHRNLLKFSSSKNKIDNIDYLDKYLNTELEQSFEQFFETIVFCLFFAAYFRDGLQYIGHTLCNGLCNIQN